MVFCWRGLLVHLEVLGDIMMVSVLINHFGDFNFVCPSQFSVSNLTSHQLTTKQHQFYGDQLTMTTTIQIYTPTTTKPQLVPHSGASIP